MGALAMSALVVIIANVAGNRIGRLAILDHFSMLRSRILISLSDMVSCSGLSYTVRSVIFVSVSLIITLNVMTLTPPLLPLPLLLTAILIFRTPLPRSVPIAGF